MRQDERERGEQQTSQPRTATILRSAVARCAFAVAPFAVTAIAGVSDSKCGMIGPRKVELDSHASEAVRSNLRSDTARIVEVFSGS